VRLILTGASGFLGSYLDAELKKSFNITSVGRSCSNSIKCDLSKDFPEFTEDYQIVVHAAGMAHVNPRTMNEEESFFNVNCIGTKILLESLGSKAVSRFVFISSVLVYGKEQGEMIDEHCALGGSSLFEKSKIQAERLIFEWCKTRKCKYLILRLPLVVGENPIGNLAKMTHAIKNGTYLRIGRGNAKKSMVLATDVACLISNWINNPKALSGIYNLTDGYHPSFYEVEELIKFNAGKYRIPSIPLFLAKLLGKIGDYFSFFPINSNTVRKIITTCTFSDEKARKELKWNPSPVISFWKESNNE
jgi:nucleoside-diphosphate-sugar epimerase